MEIRGFCSFVRGGLMCLMAVVMLASCGSGKRMFSNPVVASDWPDPTVIFNEADGYFYSVATGWNREFLRSRDLVSWEASGVRPFARETVREMRQHGASCWAPQFARIGGRYMLYLTIRSGCEDSRIACCSADNVLGPYTFEGIITDGLKTGIKDSIDPFVFTDEETGKVWLVYGSVGGIHQVELSKDGTALAPGAKYRHIAGNDVDDDPSRLTVYEGSYVFKRDGWWYLFCSSGRYYDYSYSICVGRSRSPEGPFLTKEGLDMADGHATVLLSTKANERFYGPGHNGEIITDSKGRDYMIYHVHVGNYQQNRKSGNGARPMNLQRIYWDKAGWPYFKHSEISGSLRPAL